MDFLLTIWCLYVLGDRSVNQLHSMLTISASVDFNHHVAVDVNLVNIWSVRYTLPLYGILPCMDRIVIVAPHAATRVSVTAAVWIPLTCAQACRQPAAHVWLTADAVSASQPGTHRIKARVDAVFASLATRLVRAINIYLLPFAASININQVSLVTIALS